MQEIYPKMEQADLLIFGTLVYWYGPTGKMKLLIDRMRAFIADKRLRGKRAVVVVPCEEGPSARGALLRGFPFSRDFWPGFLLGNSFLSYLFFSSSWDVPHIFTSFEF